MSDRMVHARSASGETEVVRYDRAGRWFAEEPSAGLKVRMRTVQEAADRALALAEAGGEVLLGRPGGGQFDAKVEGARARKARHGGL